jgi:hypothetical protein
MFRTHYGSEPHVYKKIWLDLQVSSNDEARIPPGKLKLDYFLMSMYFLRLYPTQLELVATFNYCRETIDQWLWYYLEKIQALKDEKIFWPDEWDDDIEDNPFIPHHLLTVDGTHCMVMERQTRSLSKDTKYYSHKFAGPGLSYEMALHLYECRIIHIRGPGKGGKNDKTTFREELMGKIPAGSKGIADNGYIADDLRDSLAFSNNRLPRHIRKLYQRAKARHETLYSRMKSFRVLAQKFRCKHYSDRDTKHKTCFEAVAVIVQYQFENGAPLFSVDHLETI